MDKWKPLEPRRFQHQFTSIQMTQRTIYLDTAASTKDRTDGMFSGHRCIANPQSIHTAGLDAARSITDTESAIIALLGGKDGRLFWTSTGSQANKLAIEILGGRCLYFSGEHRSVIDRIEGHLSIPSTKEGRVYMGELLLMLDRHGHRDIAVQLVNNETGVIQPIREVRDVLGNDWMLFSDCIQALGKITDPLSMGMDMATFSAHKSHGPKGIACLWMSQHALECLDHEPYTNHMGTPSLELINRFRHSIPDHYEMNKNRLTTRDLVERFLSNLPHDIWEINTTAERVPGILSLRFPGIDGAALQMALSDQGVMVSTGSACNSREITASHVLLSMGLTEQQALSTIRVSFDAETPLDDVIDGAKRITSTVKELRTSQ